MFRKMVELKRANDIDIFFIFRWLVLLSVTLIAFYATQNLSRVFLMCAVIFFYFVLNLTFRLTRPDLLKKQIALFLLFLSDILIVSTIFYLTGKITQDYYIFYFVTIIMVSISSGIGPSLAITVTSVVIYLWLVTEKGAFSLDNPVLLLKLVFLMLTAFITSVWSNTMKVRIEDEKRKGLKEKEELKHYYHNIIDSLDSGIAVLDKEEEIYLINPRAHELSTLSKEILPILKKTLIEAPKSRENHMVIKSNDEKYWGINWAVLRDLNGVDKGRIAVFNDITERIEMRTEMERSRRINQLGGMALRIAHDLRNPLGAIHGLAQMLKMSPKGNNSKEYADKILEASNKIDNLIEDMLDFSREYKLDLTEFDLNALIREIVDELRGNEAMNGKNIQVYIRDGERECSIKADRNKLWRVFNNLIKNALEAIPDKGNVNISVGGNGEEVITTIEDNGVGISESGLDQIFQPFVTTKSNGTGLGLSIVQRIVSAHKGRVFLSSKEGEGTVFRVELPKKGG